MKPASSGTNGTGALLEALFGLPILPPVPRAPDKNLLIVVVHICPLQTKALGNAKSLRIPIRRTTRFSARSQRRVAPERTPCHVPMFHGFSCRRPMRNPAPRSSQPPHPNTHHPSPPFHRHEHPGLPVCAPSVRARSGSAPCCRLRGCMHSRIRLSSV